MRSWASGLLLLCAASSARAEGPLHEIGALDLEALLDPQVAAASRREQRLSEAPSSVFVLGADEIERQGFRSLQEALASVPGFFITDQGAFQFGGLRGLSPAGDFTTRLLVLLDGHPINSSAAIASYLSREVPVPLAALERIEVIRGPVGGLYGPTAYFGVINLVTREASRGSSVSLSGDASGQGVRGGEGTAVLSHQLGPVEVLATADLYRSWGTDYTIPEFANSIAGGSVPGTDYEKSQSAYLRLRSGALGLIFAWSQREKGDPLAAYHALPGSTGNRWFTRFGWLQLTWDRQLGPVQLSLRAAWDDVRTADDLIYPGPPQDRGPFQDVATDRWGSGELRASLLPWEGARLTAGLQLQSHQTVQLSHYLLVPSLRDDPQHGFGLGPISGDYLQLDASLLIEQRLGNDLAFQGGLDFVHHQLFGDQAVPKLSLNWNVGGGNRLKLIYGRGVRMPTVSEALFDDQSTYLPNPALRSELAESFEAIAERQVGRFWVQLGLFRTTLSHSILFEQVAAPGLGRPPDPNDPADYRLQATNEEDRALLYGLELSGKLRLSGLVELWGGFSWQSLSGDDSAERAGFAPLVAQCALSSHGLWQPLTLSLRGQLIGPRLGPDTAGLGRARVPAAARLDASARLELPQLPWLSLQLGGTDLLASAPQEPLWADFAPLTAKQPPGRQLRLTAEARF